MSEQNGGYYAIAAVAIDLVERLNKDPQFGPLWAGTVEKTVSSARSSFWLISCANVRADRSTSGAEKCCWKAVVRTGLTRFFRW
jgi:hypothetical protein